METRSLTKADFDYVVSVIDRWWGGPSTALAHPMFFYELGGHAQVAVEQGEIVGFLLGFVTASTPPLGYVHLVGIHPQWRRRGVARTMYERFEAECKAAGATRMKAITTLGNEGSVAFHRALGWDVEEVADYAGSNRARIVFTKSI
ncbi:MAG: GNAT family N-acetyltransferase [Deltaproteobacteria bacterium]|nr:GNAT family N-acetyltransferase [Deltaproteobacteria bacterium]